MSTALVSAFYDINDVIQQSKQRPNSLDLRLRFERRQPCSPSSLASRRHSASAINSLNTKPIGTPTPFSIAPGSPKEKVFNFPVLRDRSFSTPQITEENEQQQRKRASTNSSRYKTELCRPFEENGTCKYGDKCQFAHGLNELRSLSRHPKYKTEFCRTYHTIGFCPYGPRCHFIHNDEEKRSSPPTPSHLRSLSMSSMNSGPSSPLLDAVSSPFPGSLTPPMSPSYGEVFAFSEEMANPTVANSIALSRTTAPVPVTAFAEQQNPYPSPTTSDFSPRSPMLIVPSSPTVVVSSMPSASYETDTLSSDADSSSTGSSSPPSSPGERLRRLPVFNNIA